MEQTERAAVLSMVIDWAGSEEAAERWYDQEPIPAFAGMTPAEIVAAGKVEALCDYLHGLDAGGFA